MCARHGGIVLEAVAGDNDFGGDVFGHLLHIPGLNIFGKADWSLSVFACSRFIDITDII